MARFLAHELGGDLHLTVGTERLHLRQLVLAVLDQYFFQTLGHFGRYHRLVETNGISTTAHKVDALVKPTNAHGQERHHDQNEGHAIEQILFLDKLEIRVGKEILGQRSVHAQGTSAFHIAIDEHTRDKDRGDHRSDDTDHHRGGKSLDRSLSEDEQDKAGEERSGLRVDDRRQSVLVTVGYGLFAGFPGAEFLLDSFVDDHVGIHRHTDGQDDTGKSRQGERRPQ